MVFDLAANGPNQTIWMVGTDGSYLRQIANPYPYRYSRSPYGFHADLSPDGKSLVYSTCEYKVGENFVYAKLVGMRVFELAVIDTDGGEPLRLTESAAYENFPVWSPDGSRIAYIGTRQSDDIHYHPSYGEVWVVPADRSEGTPVSRSLGIRHVAERAPVWSPNSEYLAVVTDKVGKSKTVYVAGFDSRLYPGNGEVVEVDPENWTAG